MSPEKKHWAKPDVQSLDQGTFQRWDRDKLLQVRDLVQGALELVEGSGDAPDAQSAIRAVVNRIDEQLAE